MLTITIALCTVTLIISVIDVLIVWRASKRIPITDNRWRDVFGSSIIKKQGVVAFALFRFVTCMLYCVIALWCMVINSQVVLPTLVPLGMVNLLVACHNQQVCRRSMQ